MPRCALQDWLGLAALHAVPGRLVGQVRCAPEMWCISQLMLPPSAAQVRDLQQQVQAEREQRGRALAAFEAQAEERAALEQQARAVSGSTRLLE